MQGYGMGAFAGLPYQRGAGIGGIFRGIARFAGPILMPLLKKLGLKLGERAVRTGADIIGDVREGRKLKTAAADRIKQHSREYLREMTGKGIGTRPKSLKRPAKRRIATDIFNNGKITRSKILRGSKRRA